jgi:tetratricopeptide (TPR) repeat protein/ssDNA-binding Zn-finger/Zn-ribbon topoisomerase 1
MHVPSLPVRSSPIIPTPAHFALLAAFVGLVACGKKEPDPASSESKPASAAPVYSPYHSVPGATYVGAETCRSCHAEAYTDWTKSDHHQAMLPATEENVAADFNEVTFEHRGHTWRFFRKDAEFWVNAEGADGERADFKIEYTFGFEPLQQYLISFPGGRYQALQVCWDTRPASEGGQRWFHLYPDEEIPPGDLLHWSGIHFNWNYMCADCHSTDLKKNYDPVKKDYHTTWSEMNVSCEACHGPASKHLEWAAAPAELPGKGLLASLKEPTEGAWAVNPDTLKPYRTRPLASNVQIETCARCHSHRELLESDFTPGKPFLETHAPSILSDRLYHHDGQVDEEVYVYGSFVQSKMFHAGVRCTDCHHPHTMKPLAEGNALCVRCHVPQKFDTPEHHFHSAASTGARCVECHMPHKTYMVVDDRRDHSLRIPRPDLSKKLGTPNACNQCHQDKDVDWATEAFHKWWGTKPRLPHYGEILASARRGEVGSMEKLLQLADDPDRPGIARATALAELAAQPIDLPTLNRASKHLRDADPLARAEAVTLMERLPADERLRAVAARLNDPVKTVRIEAARILATSVPLMSPEQRTAFDRAAGEFETKQRAILDRAGGYLRMALFYNDLGLAPDAEAAYRKAIEIEPESLPAQVNLAELLSGQQRAPEAEAVYRAAVASQTLDENIGAALDAFARFLIRQKRYEEGLVELKKAARLLPLNARTQYFLGVALNSMGQPAEGLGYLKAAHQVEPNNPEYLVGIATVARDAGRLDEAFEAAQKLARLTPQDPQAVQLLEQIRMLKTGK